MSNKAKTTDTSSLYAELSKLQQNREFEKGIKICNKILTVSPQDVTAFQCKILCLLNLGRFDDALKQMRSCHLAEKVDISFEKSYCHYRKNECLEALSVLETAENGVTVNSMKREELKAQILYRLERYEECHEVYKSFTRNTSDNFESERITNVAAVAMHLKDDGFRKLPEGTYEMVYNKACCLLAAELPEEAEKLLEKAEKMCVESLAEEDVDPEDVDQETGIIKVQRAFAIQKQGRGREKEAQGIYNAVLKTKPSDVGLVAIASNNILAINRDQNVFDSKKRIKAATADGVEHKLTSFQRSAIAKNNALLAMYTNQVKLCQDLVLDLVRKGTVEKLEGDCIVAAVLSRAEKTKEALDVIKENSRSADELQRVLVACHILLEKGSVAEAVALLESLPEQIRFRKGVLSTLVMLCLAVNDKPKAAGLLSSAVKRSNDGDMAVVWRKTAEFHLKENDSKVAAKSLEELLRLEPGNVHTLAQLVLAYAKYDLPSALAVSKKLPKFTYGDVADIESLEDGMLLGPRYGKKLGRPGTDPASPKAASPENQAREREPEKKKRKRKKRLPKDFNPNVDPDPERWLPRRERAGYRKNRKDRRKAEKFTGAQGVTSGSAEVYDYSQKPNASSPHQTKGGKQKEETSVGPRQQIRKSQQKKKKGNKQRF